MIWRGMFSYGVARHVQLWRSRRRTARHGAFWKGLAVLVCLGMAGFGVAGHVSASHGLAGFGGLGKAGLCMAWLVGAC
jgi:hypothetical protein